MNNSRRINNVSVLLVQAAAGGKKRSLMSRLLGSA